MPIIEEQHTLSEEVEEIITDTPPWILRWGLTVFFLVFVSLVIFSALIKMPDKLSGKIRIESKFRPEEVIAHQSGKLKKLFVNENTVVDSGVILGNLESNANPEEVLSIDSSISIIQKLVNQRRYEDVKRVYINDQNNLGELQSSFLTFSQSFNELKTFLSDGIYDQKRFGVHQEIAELKLQRLRLENQQKIYQQDLAIAQRDFDANQKLFDNKVISISEFKQAESNYLNKKVPLENIATSLIQNNISQNTKQTEFTDLANQISVEKENFIAKVNQFKSEIDQWRYSYLLISNSKGKVVFNHSLKEGDYVAANTPLFYIENKNAGGFEGEMRIGQYAFGKIKTGQHVLIRLNAYPYQQFGVLNGRISYLSSQTIGDSLYVAKIQFLNGNETS